MSRRTERAVRAAEAGAETAARSFRTGIAVETKGEKTDVVTQADRDAQRRVKEVINEEFEEDPIVGEEDETPSTVPDEGPAGIVDPIDGTANYVRGVGVWTTSVVATVDGEPVGGATVCPDLGDTFRLESGDAFRNGQQLSVSERSDPEEFFVVPTIWWDFDRRDEYAAACRGIVEQFGDMRRFGSAQFELGLCAAGAVEAVVTNVRANPWDTVLGVGLVRAAGGTVTNVHGDLWRHDSRGLVASNGQAHDVVLDAVREIEAETR